MNKYSVTSALTIRICMDLAFFARKFGVKIIFLESCTGGLTSSWISSLNGSSSWFEGALVTYSNRMKNVFLEVKEKELSSHKDVSSLYVYKLFPGEMWVARLHRCSQACTGRSGHQASLSLLSGKAGRVCDPKRSPDY